MNFPILWTDEKQRPAELGKKGKEEKKLLKKKIRYMKR